MIAAAPYAKTMKFKKLNGADVYQNINKFGIKWGKKSRSKFQWNVKQFLKPYWENHICYEEMTIVGTRLSLDIVNMTLRAAVEVQGHQHIEYNEWMHDGNRINYLKQMMRDDEKSKWCELNGITLVYILPDELEQLSKKWFKEKYELDLSFGKIA